MKKIRIKFLILTFTVVFAFISSAFSLPDAAQPRIVPDHKTLKVSISISDSSADLNLVPDEIAAPKPTPTPKKTKSPLPPPGSEKSKQKVQIFLIALKTGGKVGCGDSVVPMNTGIPRTKSNTEDIKAALKYLFQMKNKFVGTLYNPVSYSTIRVQDVEYTGNDHLIIWLSGKYRPSGDDCDNTRVKAQIWSTAKQFGVKSIDFYINGPHPFGDFVSNDG